MYCKECRCARHIGESSPSEMTSSDSKCEAANADEGLVQDETVPNSMVIPVDAGKWILALLSKSIDEL